MSSSNDSIYTAADIEKYHRGLLTPQEMHAMEKAALEDPLLSEAMDGFALLQTPATEDISDLKARLQNRIQSETSSVPVVPLLPAAPKSNFRWWRAAAAVLLIGALGVAVYQLGFDKHSSPDIAQNQQAAPEKEAGPENKPTPDTTPSSIPMSDSITPTTDNNARAVDKSERLNISETGDKETNDVTEEKVALSEEPAAPATPDLAINQDYKAKELQKAQEARKRSIVSSQKPSANEGYYYNQRANQPSKDSVAPYLYDVAANNTRQQGNTAFRAPEYRIFRGKIVDQNQQALPFANITNTRDQVGTYSDANGNFVLISQDSALDVQVRSIGFSERNYRLVPQAPGNTVELMEDQNIQTRVFDTTYRVVNLARLNPMKHEETEPVDGWRMYDTYVANNLRMPENEQRKVVEVTPTVELSFQVDKMGQPVNIVIVRSQCKECNEEAIRLIREGPRWKPTKKGRRTNVVLNF